MTLAVRFRFDTLVVPLAILVAFGSCCGSLKLAQGGYANWLTLSCPLIVFLLAILALTDAHKAERRRRLGLCAECGYDLRASPSRCPECGTVTGGSDPLD